MSWKHYLDEQQDVFLEQLSDFLRIPSISSLPQHQEDVYRAGEWVAERLKSAGMENVKVMPTKGHPVVYADYLHAQDQPTVMIYGHFDVQPVDPVELWESDPFDPTIKDGKIYARGASDDKGNMLAPILAAEAMLKSTGGLPINIKFLFEGQEEIGSPDIAAWIAENKGLLACDFVLSSDGGQYADDQPAILVGLKGLCALEIDVYGANSDLHSGVYGGAVQNPLHALSKVLSSMRDDDGKILVEGFYDNVVDLSADDKAEIARIPFDEDGYKANLNIPEVFGEPGYTTLERAWARPTLEVNGMWGGFQGEGVKTVLPKEAHAKITCRLVADQDPHTIVEALKAHVLKHLPSGVRVELKESPSHAVPYLMPNDHPGNQAAAKVYQHFYDKPPFFMRMGGSIPICGMLLEQLGVYTVNFAFALEDEQMHAPNEFFRLHNFRRGQEAYCLIMEEIAS